MGNNSAYTAWEACVVGLAVAQEFDGIAKKWGWA
jgi:hypothetical protein